MARELKEEALGAYLLDMMKHAVGYPKFYRNNYCLEIDNKDVAKWKILVGMGLAKAGPTINDGRDRYFHVTHAGIAMLKGGV